jgi:hypothetical protein
VTDTQLEADRAAIQALTDPGVPWPAARAAVQAIPEQRLHHALGLGPADVMDELPEGTPFYDPTAARPQPIVQVRLVATPVDGYPPTVIHQWRAECIRGIGTHSWRWFGAPLTLDGTAWQQGMDDLGQIIDQHIREAHSA